MNVKSHIPLVSVLMPIWNAAEYLNESLGSIVNQSYKNLEIIIVDDASTDQSIDIVTSYCDPRVVIIKNYENLGLAESLNVAIRHSSGELLARMDGDDIAHNDRIARQVAFLNEHPEVDVLGSAMQYFGESKYVNHFPEDHAACKSYLIFNVCFGHPSVMLRRKIFDDKKNFYKPIYRQYGEEYDLWCRLVEQFRFHNLNDILVYYRTYPSEIKSNAEEQRKRNAAGIRWHYLNKYLGQISETDWDKHNMASFSKQCSSVDDLYGIDEWFRKILDWNGITKSFNESVLVEQLAQRYFEVCYAHTKFGLQSMKIYFKSGWQRRYNPTKKNLLKFFIKLAIKA